MNQVNQSGLKKLVIDLAEDAWQGDAIAVVRVDGEIKFDGAITAANATAGQMVDLGTVDSATAHNVTVEFTNDAWGGTPDTDRNLYVKGLSVDGVASPGNTVTLYTDGVASLYVLPTVAVGPPVVGLGPDTVAFTISEDAWLGDAQFVVLEDGQQVGEIQFANALHGAGAEQEVDLKGDFSGGGHTVGIRFLNDAWGGTPDTDRNLYVDSIKLDGIDLSASKTLYSNGDANFTLPETTLLPDGTNDVKPVLSSVVIGNGPDTLEVTASGDAWLGDALMTVTVDGQKVATDLDVRASHRAGQVEKFDILGNFGTGDHTVSVSFTNDAWGGTPDTDRNLYVESVTLNGGTKVEGLSCTLYSNGTLSGSLHSNSNVVLPEPLRTSEFITSMGVNTHINYNDGAYANLINIINDLNYLGINHVRDGLNTPGQFGGPSIDAYKTIARAGVKFTLMVGGGGQILASGGTPTNPSLDQRVGYIDELARTVPGSILAVEGTNEINNQPISYGGQGGTGAAELEAALSMQKSLYSIVHSDATLSGVPVYYFTGYNAGGIPLGPDPTSTPGLADFNNQHPYPNGGDPPADWVSRTRALPNETTVNEPAVYTETGYSSNGGVSGAVNLDVQAKYTLDLLLDTAASGIKETDLYELLDAYAPGSPQGDSGYGLFDSQGNAKPVAVAIHNMNMILADPGPASSTFVPSTLSYAVNGTTSTEHSLEMARSDGSHVIALWDERPIWNAATGTQNMDTVQNVSVTLNGGVGSYTVSEFDPLQGTKPISITTDVNQVNVAMSDHPVFLVVSEVGNGTLLGTSTRATLPIDTTPVSVSPLSVVQASVVPAITSFQEAGDVRLNTSAAGISPMTFLSNPGNENLSPDTQGSHINFGAGNLAVHEAGWGNGNLYNIVPGFSGGADTVDGFKAVTNSVALSAGMSVPESDMANSLTHYALPTGSNQLLMV